ncbi:hypothetical protein [Paraliomyxa miuraensis]|uniref:hypothetical protein n=1 Tax=Paraliomyxa miuraensis TaxID=376150 RepID=UPI00225A7168|nr:hypothetical protein [Paraliomyxa miuraensis]MCX4243084.1 hypothetical protein [Paraliomyxa miuraensis]
MPPVLLWLSYQRYALLGLAAIAGLGLGAVALEHAFWAWLGVVLVTAALLPLVVHVWREFPRKWRATQLATRRIAAGTFRPVALEGYCGDPCWRVVAAEILRRTGMPRARRRELLAQLRAQHEAKSHALLIVDHQRGTLLRVEGDVTVTTTLPPSTTTS